ncbi:MAG: hypothetical protein methR_P3305 [Methyloprofundus sp.]|nr:MAG: hypothetical protein methR_P3305 [Methyloprofundus sp.]
MQTKNLLVFIASSFVMGQALAIEPVYEGDDGIRAKVFATNCLACHSSELTGGSRNGAPSNVDFDTYAEAVAHGMQAVNRAVMLGNMPPSFSPLPELDDEQKQALKNWQALGFPEKHLPAIFSANTAELVVPAIYVKDANGDIVLGGSVKFELLSNPSQIQFGLTDFQELEESEPAEHVHM